MSSRRRSRSPQRRDDRDRDRERDHGQDKDRDRDRKGDKERAKRRRRSSKSKSRSRSPSPASKELIELEKQRKLKRQQELEERLADEETKNKIEFAIKKAITSAIHAPDFRAELNELVAKEQQKLRDFVLEQTRDQKTILVDYVRQQQELEVQEKLKAKARLDQIIEDNNRRIAQQTQQLQSVSAEKEKERLAELERIQREKEELKRKEDSQRLLEIQQKVEEEQKKQALVAKSKEKRPGVSFSLFQ